MLGTETKAAVVGAGTMGIGIAQVLATAGHAVHVVDDNDRVLTANRSKMFGFLDRLVVKGKLDADERKYIEERVSFASGLSTIPVGTGIVVEAIVEDLEIKQELFRGLELLVRDDTLLASNTSSLSVTALASACKMPERVVGLHFFNPAPLLDLVEIVPGLQTSSSVIEGCRVHLEAIGKAPVVAKDTPGFIVNRVARPFYGEALRLLEEGVATAPTIDRAMREVGGFRMGPFELMDLIGNDVNYAVTKSVYESFFNDPRYRPSFIQKQMVDAGRLGKKSGVGYYDYSDSANNGDGSALELSSAQAIVDRILAMLINEAVDAVFWRIASASDIETAMTKGVNYPRGLLSWGKEIGFDAILSRISKLQEEYAEDRYRPSPLLRKLADGQLELDV